MVDVLSEKSTWFCFSANFHPHKMYFEKIYTVFRSNFSDKYEMQLCFKKLMLNSVEHSRVLFNKVYGLSKQQGKEVHIL